jgi:hypothetical protein
VKSPEAWDESDLLGLIATKSEEHSQLEFKRAESLENTDARKNEISKDVSAFANSGGGTIVYGIEESDDLPRCAKDLSAIDCRKVSKEWLEHVINGRIHPRIQGVRINPVTLSSQGPGKLAYVVCIPESSTAHQASDKKYYKRFNFESVPMEDYEIRLVMNRASRPCYSTKLEAKRIQVVGNRKHFEFRACVENMSEVAGHEVSVVLSVPCEFAGGGDGREIVRDEIPYLRIAMTHVESSHLRRSIIPLLGPFTPHWLESSKTINLRVDVSPTERFRAFVCVFDKFGLAIEASYLVYMSALNIELLGETPGPRRAPWAFEASGQA